MAEGSGPSEEPHITFNIKAASDAKYVLTLPAATTVADVKAKLSTSEYADIPVDRIRLIYSGRVLKDPDSLETIKIKDGHTVHLVKGAESNARQNPASQAGGSSPSVGQDNRSAGNVPTNLAAGTGNNPLAALTGARYAGFHNLPGADMFGPDGGMGPPPDPDSVLRMLENPQVLSQMNEAMNNPQYIEMLSNLPMIRDNPMARQMLQNPEFRRSLTDPNSIRLQLQMQRAMRGQGGNSAFPAPGVTNTTPQQPGQQDGQTQDNNAAGGPGQQQQPGMDPFTQMLFGNAGGQGAAANPFAALFNPQNTAGSNATTGQNQPASPSATASSNNQNTGTSGPTSPQAGQDTNQNQNPPPNPFAAMFGPPPSGGAGGEQAQNPLMQAAANLMQNPEAMRAMMQMMGGGAGGGGLGAAGAGAGGAPGEAGGNPFGMFGGGMGMPQQPPDNRPPEERYAEQLRQLNDMGFYNFERNVRALRQAGGSVQGAIEMLLSEP